MLLLVLIVVAGAVAWLLIAQPWRGLASESTPETTAAPTSSASESPTPTTSPLKSPTPTPTASPTPGPPEPCRDDALKVVALTDKDAYASGQNPKLAIELTNTGDVDCTLNVGTSTQAFTITSGSDTWWRSTDCQTKPSDMVVTIAAGQTVSTAEPIVWDRTRSSVDTCGDENRQYAPGGGASYHVEVSIGGVESESTRQFQLY